MATSHDTVSRRSADQVPFLTPDSARVFGMPLRVPAAYGAVPRAVHEALVFTLKEQLEILMGLLAGAATHQDHGAATGGDTAPGRLRDSRLRGQRALVVDDDATQATLLVRRLVNAGFDQPLVEVAASGLEALVAATERPFRLVFVDWQMPEMNGIDTTTRLRAIMPATPIVGCTSDYSRQARAAFLAAGADDCLAKPVSQPLLDAVVLRWLSDEPAA